MRPRHGNPCEPLAAGTGAGAAGGQPGVGPGDSFHILARGDTLDALPSVPVEKITFVQLADAPYMKMDLLEWSRHFRCFPGQGAAAGGVCRADHPLWLPRPGRWRSSMTVFAPRRTVRRPKMVIVRCCGWRSKPAVGSRRPMPICFHRRRCRSITGWSLSSLPPAPPRRSARGNICRRWVFSTRKPPLQTGDAVAQRRGADRHQPSAAQLGRPFYQRHGVSLCAMALRVEHSASLVARARALGYATAGRRRAERNADPAICAPTAALSISSTPGRLSTSAIFICVMA